MPYIEPMGIDMPFPKMDVPSKSKVDHRIRTNFNPWMGIHQFSETSKWPLHDFVFFNVRLVGTLEPFLFSHILGMIIPID